MLEAKGEGVAIFTRLTPSDTDGLKHPVVVFFAYK
jgi:hypothetical protein